jgi:hypothetical protein
MKSDRNRRYLLMNVYIYAADTVLLECKDEGFDELDIYFKRDNNK